MCLSSGRGVGEREWLREEVGNKRLKGKWCGRESKKRSRRNGNNEKTRIN